MNLNEQHAYQRWPLFNKLLRNNKFKTRFYERAEELMATNFKYEVAEPIIKAMMNKVKPYKKDAMKRWGAPDIENRYIDWINFNQHILNWVKDKEKTFLPQLHKHLFGN
jgi:hypothetical protein